MNTTSSFNRGATAGVLLMIGGQAVHWFIDSANHGASSARTAAVALQAVVGIGAYVWLTIRERRRASPTT